MESQKFFIDNIEITLKKSARAKRLNIRIKPYLGVSVSVPGRMTFSEAKKFTLEHSDWIIKNSMKMKEKESESVIFDENTDFCTKSHKLFIERTTSDKHFARVMSDRILVKIPVEADISSSEIQKNIQDSIIRAYRKEAQLYLPQRLNELSIAYNLKYNDLRIKKLKSRWGSCSSLNNINLSLFLMKLPDRLIDYVLLHELAHVVHKNHSKRFWSYLDTICPNSKALNKELKMYQIEF